jgi:hypothetical protein
MQVTPQRPVLSRQVTPRVPRFFFETIGSHHYSQGGAYNRAIMGIRIEEWPDDKIKAMHKLFLEVAVTTNLLVGCPAA